MNLKQKVHAKCLDVLNKKIASLKKSVQELEEGTESDSKSSAGDKHETARAMMQIEQEKLSKQLNEALTQYADLKKFNDTNASAHITKGSLITTNHGIIYVSIALGKIMIDTKPIVVLSPQSPLGAKLMGLKVNETTEMNDTKYIIQQID